MRGHEESPDSVNDADRIDVDARRSLQRRRLGQQRQNVPKAEGAGLSAGRLELLVQLNVRLGRDDDRLLSADEQREESGEECDGETDGKTVADRAEPACAYGARAADRVAGRESVGCQIDARRPRCQLEW